MIVNTEGPGRTFPIVIYCIDALIIVSYNINNGHKIIIVNSFTITQCNFSSELPSF